MRLRHLALLVSLLPLQGCALFRRPMVDVEHERVEFASGVEFEDVVTGIGRPVTAEDEVTLDYTGWLADGTRFDASLDRGMPVSLVVGEAPILGWREGIPGMKAGGKRRLLVPSEQAYGAYGVPGLVPPDTALIFLIELWAIAGEDPPVRPPGSQRLDRPGAGAPQGSASDAGWDDEDWR